MKEDICIKAAAYNDAYRHYMDALNKAYPWSGTIPATMAKAKYAQACALDVCLKNQRLINSIMKKDDRVADWKEEPDWEEDE